MENCPQCGRPLERADDFWYCDNPACPRRAAAQGRTEKASEAEPDPKAPELPRPRQEP